MADDRARVSVANLKRATAALRTSVLTPMVEPRDVSGAVKDFEIAYELAWKALKRTLEAEGHAPSSARDSFEQAYQLGWLPEGDVWLAMIGDRNLTVHTYNEAFAQALVQRIRDAYLPALESLLVAVEQRA